MKATVIDPFHVELKIYDEDLKCYDKRKRDKWSAKHLTEKALSNSKTPIKFLQKETFEISKSHLSSKFS